uniref:Uncharacterized protein n=1 Tax=Anguilla anguilla TaxID=7936 RepID=A0A0E9WMA0_ANGAN
MFSDSRLSYWTIFNLEMVL